MVANTSNQLRKALLRSVGCAAAAVLLTALLWVSAYCAPGDLDPSFGSGGKVLTVVGPATSDRGNAVAIQSNGQIVVAGQTTQDEWEDALLLRYNTDGSLDTTFGPANNGKVTNDFGGLGGVFLALVIQADGKIVTAGLPPGRIGLARYNTDGSLDTSFGGGTGTATLTIFGNGGARGLAVQPDGKYVVVGDDDPNPQAGADELTLARFNHDGTLDTTFGNNLGYVTATFGNFYSIGFAIALQSDGKIVVAGATGTSLNCASFLVARFLTNGQPDPSFGNAGTAVTHFLSACAGDEATAVALQNDGKIVALGGAGGDYTMARFTTNGHLDSGFGIGGKVTTAFGSVAVGEGVAIQPNGDIVAAGFGGPSIVSSHYEIARCLGNGTLDSTFGVDGITKTIFGTFDEADGVALQNDGKIVVAGTSSFPAREEEESRDVVSLARYLGDDADLSILKTASSDTVEPGGRLTYSLSVHNAGPQSADEVTVTDVIPPGLKFASVTTSKGTCAGPAIRGRITCRIGTLEDGADALIKLGTLVDLRRGTVTNTATVSSTTPDPMPSNNVSSVTTTIAYRVR